MQVPEEVRNEYKIFDPETALFLNYFDEEPGSKVLEVGSHDAPLAYMLAKCGFHVLGVDLRDSDQPSHPNRKHIKGDFCTLPDSFWEEYRGKFDAFVSVSSIEHFGLSVYGEGYYLPYLDVVAMKYAWDSLREGGSCYVTVPIGGKFVEVTGHWRVYDWNAVCERLIQSFCIESIVSAVMEDFENIGRKYKLGTEINWLDILSLRQGQPNISVLLKLRKIAREVKP